MRFKPAIIISQVTPDGSRREEIKLFLSDWLALTALDNHIKIQLTTLYAKEYKEEPFTIANIDSCIFGFKFNPVRSTMVIRQLGWQLEFNLEEWNSLMESKDLVDGFFLLSEYARDGVQHFYTNNYIPKCIELKVPFLYPEQYSSILPNERRAFYIRLCKEFETKMKQRILKDINKAVKRQQNENI